MQFTLFMILPTNTIDADDIELDMCAFTYDSKTEELLGVDLTEMDRLADAENESKTPKVELMR